MMDAILIALALSAIAFFLASTAFIIVLACTFLSDIRRAKL